MTGAILYNTPHLIPWDWRIAADLFFGGIGVGAFFVAVLGGLSRDKRYDAACKVGAVISPLLVIVGILFMLSELGHPFRLWRTLTGFNLSSPISWGGPLQGLFVLIGFAHAYGWLRPAERLRTVIGIIGMPLGLAVGVYHGLLLAALEARPLWNTGLITLSAVWGFATTGMAAVLLLMCFRPTGSGKTAESGNVVPSGFRSVFVAALIVQLFTIFAWWGSLYSGSTNASEALAAAAASLGSVLWALGIGLGLVVPIVLELATSGSRKRGARALDVAFSLLTALLVLMGGFVFRYTVLIGGQIL